MTNTIDKAAQPEALRLAAALSQESEAESRGVKYSTAKKAAAELRTLDAENQLLRSTHDRLKTAFNEWSDKTNWVRKTIQPQELGKHIADVLRERIERLTSALAAAEARNATLTDEAARELIEIARDIEALKRECGMDPESPIAIQNGRYMALSYKVRARAAASISTKEDGPGCTCQGADGPDYCERHAP